MNVIAINLKNISHEALEALKTRCVREGKSMEVLITDLIEQSNSMIIQTPTVVGQTGSDQ